MTRKRSYRLNKKGPLALIVLDGFGYRAEREGNAIALAEMPHYGALTENYPHTLIQASGECVGLPAGVMGNSNVGHLCLGAGRVLRTDVERINREIKTGEFFHNLALNAAIDNAVKHDRALHLMGLISDGLVHSSQEHAYALLRLAKEREVRRLFVHCFLDGRDTPPSSAEKYVAAMQDKLNEIGIGEIATVIGRYYAMDRDKRWERTERAYKLLVEGEGRRVSDSLTGIRESYEHGITDEFIQPIVITRESGESVATIEDGDSVIFFNFRRIGHARLPALWPCRASTRFLFPIVRTCILFASQPTTRHIRCRWRSRLNNPSIFLPTCLRIWAFATTGWPRPKNMRT